MRSLQAKMFIVFALIATAPLLALGYLSLVQTREATLDQVGADHEQTALAAAALVVARIEAARHQLEAEAEDMQDEAANGDAQAWGTALGLATSRAADFDALWVLDSSGRPVAGEARTDARLVLDTPIDAGHRLYGAASMVPIARVLAPLSTGGEIVFVVDLQGALVASPIVGPPMDAAGLAIEGGRQGHGVERGAVVAFARIGEPDWIVVDAVPASRALAGLARVTAVVVVLSGGLVGAVLLASVVVARRIVAPVRELTRAAEELAAGNLSRRIEPRGTDEFGVLARTFNQMAERIAESLEGLRRSETRYRGLVESANDLIFSIQGDGALAFLSPLAKRLFGAGVGQGTPAVEVVLADDRPGFQEAVQRVFDRGEASLFVPFRVLGSDGATRVVLANFTPVFEQAARPARVLVVARDVTEERRQELFREKSFLMARLVSEERDLGELARRGLDVLTAFVGARGGAIYLAQATGLQEAAVAGVPVPQEVAQRAFERGEVVRVEMDGHSLLAVPLVERGEVLGLAALVAQPGILTSGAPVDVVASLGAQLAVGLRRSLFEARLQDYAAQLESRVAERTAELTAKSQEMEGFLYSVSHDLKAPLISMQGYAKALEEDYATLLGDEGGLYLERIRENATFMESLILDLLELSRVGRVQGEMARVEMADVMREVRARVADRLREEGGHLDVAAGLPAVMGDHKRLEQLFTNLVENAVKYRHPDRAPHIAVKARVEGAEVVVSVADNGRGIPERFQHQLFNIFQRLPSPDMPDPGGTGIGLAIVKRIAQTHGGRVWMESVEGEGTTFHVALPEAR